MKKQSKVRKQLIYYTMTLCDHGADAINVNLHGSCGRQSFAKDHTASNRISLRIQFSSAQHLSAEHFPSMRTYNQAQAT